MNPRSAFVALARTGTLALAAVVVGNALTGCSQVAAIAPVGGGHEAEVRYAAIDILLDEGTAILIAPVCTSDSGGTVVCTGETVDGTGIDVVSAAADPSALTVRIGENTFYEGSILDVLERAAQGAS